MKQAALASVAILKVNRDDIEHRDYIENYVPFVVECIKGTSAPLVQLQHVQQLMLQELGLRGASIGSSCLHKRADCCIRGCLRGHFRPSRWGYSRLTNTAGFGENEGRLKPSTTRTPSGLVSSGEPWGELNFLQAFVKWLRAYERR